MIKQVTQEIVREESVTVAVVCDVCKKEYAVDNFIELQEFHHVRFTGGYGSVFGDEVEIKCDICQHCLLKMIGDYISVNDEA